MRVDEALMVLEVPPSATPAEIKAAYRRMVKVCHPDRHALDEGRRARAEETLKRVVQAYQCLRHGVPPPPPSEPKKAPPEATGSMYSVRQDRATGRRRSQSGKKGRRGELEVVSRRVATCFGGTRPVPGADLRGSDSA